MINNRITEGVGKKIVEALKQQNDDIEIKTVRSDVTMETPVTTPQETQEKLSQSLQEAVDAVEVEAPKQEPQSQTFNFSQIAKPQENFMQSGFGMNSQMYNQQTPDLSAVDDMDLPSNVAVLKQLITKLPANVSKQTGALIIRQTMEALGISMNSVLNEAQQVQENLNNSALECQNSIVEYRKQIGILEAKAQNYQRQAAVMNDIINLFIQTR